MNPATLERPTTESIGLVSERKSSEPAREDATKWAIGSERQNKGDYRSNSLKTRSLSVRSKFVDRATATVDAEGRRAVVVSAPIRANGDSLQSNELDAGLSSLRKLLGSRFGDEELLIAATRSLRRTSRVLKNTRPRHAAFAMVMSDALAYTNASDVDGLDGWRPFEHAYRRMLEPFIPSESEEALITDLLDAGWRLSPSFDSLPEDFITAAEEA